MGKSSQSKGRRAEIELAKIFQTHGYNVKPGEPVSFGTVPDLVGLENVHIEVKRRETVAELNQSGNNGTMGLNVTLQDIEHFVADYGRKE